MMDRAQAVLSQLGIRTCNIMLTGSLALDALGLLPKGRQVHDVDFIVRNADINTVGILTAISSLYDGQRPYDDPNFYVFASKGVVYNIWLKDFEDTGIRTDMGMWVSPVDKLLEKKRGYGRKKDFQDLADIATMVLKG